MIEGIDSATGHTSNAYCPTRGLGGGHLTGVLALLVPLAVVVAIICQIGLVAPIAQATPAHPDTYYSVADMRAHHPFYVAHHGGSADWPEMSMTAYANAAAWGMGALEVSVARTSDGVFFGLHDATLDRTSQVSGSINPTTLSWAYLSANYKNKLNASSPQGESYTRVSDVFAAFAAKHVIFVDTKAIGDTQQRTDLINLMLSYAPASHWVLKGYYNDTALTKLAHLAGIQTWGYYYANDLVHLDATAQNWDMLGLELSASQAEWDQIKAKGKPVIAFLISKKANLGEALTKGADGMMTSSVPAVFGAPRLQAGDHETLAVAPGKGSAQSSHAARCKMFKPVVRGHRIKVRICIRGSWTHAKIKKARKQAAKQARAKIMS